MDDLDALLADLQSTTQHISYQQYQQQQPQQPPGGYNGQEGGYGSPAGGGGYGPGPVGSYATSPTGGYHSQAPRTVIRKSDSSTSSQDSRSSTPPLPPPPAQELLDSVPSYRSVEPVYEQQTFQVRETTPSSDRSRVGVGGDPGATVEERMSALSTNLSELDQLLQDLNSAQFQAEVDRKSSAVSSGGLVNGVTVNNNNSINSGGAGVKLAPPVAPKPTKPTERATVESLLDELESAVPPARTGPGQGYQEVRSTSHLATHHTFHATRCDLSPTLPPANHHHNLPPPSLVAVAHHPQQAPQAASTATKELDELMASLSEFKQQSQTVGNAGGDYSWNPVEPAYAKPVKSRSLSSQSPTSPPPTGSQPTSPMAGGQNANLDTMLGDLQSDMSRQGVNTKKKGVCAACNKPIVGQVIAALGRTWHVEHFVCAHCEQPLGTSNFYERDNQAYCEQDYHNLFAPRCAYCSGPIVDKCITALEKMWHPEHFFCAQCGRQFGDEDFHEKNGKAYCRDDYFQMFAPKCGGCGMPIMENYISALNRQWHPQCFCCWECQAPFGTGSFYDHDGLPYCETHYHAKKGSLCASCQKPITGRCITAMFKKFHPEHFVCAFCLKQLNKGTFKEQNDKPYCHPCFVKLFG